MSTVVHVGENRGTVLDVVLGDSVPVASCRAADGLKNDGVKCDRGLLCSLCWCTGDGVKEQRPDTDDTGLDGVGDLSNEVNSDVEMAGGVGGVEGVVSGTGDTTFRWGVHGLSTSGVPWDGGLGGSSTSTLSGDPSMLSGSLCSDCELLRCTSCK